MQLVFLPFHPVLGNHRYCDRYRSTRSFCTPECRTGASNPRARNTHCCIHPTHTPTPSTLARSHPILHTPVAALSSTTPCPFAELHTPTFQAMTLTVVVGPAAGRNCGLAAPPLLGQPRVRRLGDWPQMPGSACEGTGLLLRASYSIPIASHMACRGSL